MAFEILHGVVTLEASADLSAHQYRFISMTAGKAAVISAAGDLADGVLQNDPVSGGAAEIVPLNGSIVKVQAGAVVAINADVTPDVDGKAITSTSTDEICGKALEASTADGEFITVLILRRGVTA